MTSAADTDPSPADIRTDYLAQMRQKRMLNMILLMIFAALMVAGFYTADARNAGGFWNGWRHILDFPADVIGEAIERANLLPGYFVKYLPSLLETINIAGIGESGSGALRRGAAGAVCLDAGDPWSGPCRLADRACAPHP